MNGTSLEGREIKVNWAYSSHTTKEETAHKHHLFIGDLSNEINDSELSHAFGEFGEVVEAKVIIDPLTKRSKGYGFISFKDIASAEVAIREMNGKVLGTRVIKVNWANLKSNGDTTQTTQSHGNRNVYIGNLSSDVTSEQIHDTFEAFGEIQQVRLFAERGIAFVKFATHKSAAEAISNMNHKSGIGSNIIKCSWGKEKQQPTPSQVEDVPPGFGDVSSSTFTTPWTQINQWSLPITNYDTNLFDTEANRGV